MIDEFGPAIILAGHRASRPQLDRWRRTVQARYEVVPGNIYSQILRFVHDPRAVLERNEQNRASAIVSIGDFAVDRGDARMGVAVQKVATERFQVTSEATNELA